jgi:hypothetical protein
MMGNGRRISADDDHETATVILSPIRGHLSKCAFIRGQFRLLATCHSSRPAVAALCEALTAYCLLTCTFIYSIVRACARQKQLAKFKTPKIFLRLELPRSRQRIAFFQAANLARECEVAIWWGGNSAATNRRGAIASVGKARERA